MVLLCLILQITALFKAFAWREASANEDVSHFQHPRGRSKEAVVELNFEIKVSKLDSHIKIRRGSKVLFFYQSSSLSSTWVRTFARV